MTSAYYIGTSDVRTISATDWSAAGAPGSATVWNQANGWSVNQNTLSTAQVAVLAAQSDFVTGQADLPRPGSTAVSKKSTDPLVQSDLTAVLGKGTIITATNKTAVVTPATSNDGAGYLIPFTTITVPPTTADVWLEYSSLLYQTAAGDGMCGLYIYDVTLQALLFTHVDRMPGAPTLSVTASGSWRLGPITTAKTICLDVLSYIVPGAGTNPGIQAYNSLGSPTFLTAVGR